MSNTKFHAETSAIHGSVHHKPDKKNKPVIPPLISSTVFYDTPDRSEDQYHYTRTSNPNRDQLENVLCTLEGGEACASFSSGMAASAAVFGLLGPGSHIILPEDVYHGTRHYLKQVLAPKGILVSEADMTSPDSIRQNIRPDTRMIWIETPSNPMLQVTDLKRVKSIADEHQLLTVADNTWPTPLNLSPFEFGIDFIVHSATKYLGGHSDILAGAVIAREAGGQFETIRHIQVSGGAVPSPFDCWLLTRSIKTLPARMKIHNENGMRIAGFLSDHPAVEAVHYPGLAEHPGHNIAALQMKGFGGMISFQVKGGEKEAKRVVFSSELIVPATSLGGVESTWEHRLSSEGPESVTPANLIRLSAGIEHYKDLISDIENSLNHL